MCLFCYLIVQIGRFQRVTRYLGTPPPTPQNVLAPRVCSPKEHRVGARIQRVSSSLRPKPSTTTCMVCPRDWRCPKGGHCKLGRFANAHQQSEGSIHHCDLFRPKLAAKTPIMITLHDVLEPFKQALLASRDGDNF